MTASIALFYAIIALYFISTVLQFMGTAFKKDILKKLGFAFLVLGAVVHLVFMILRGIEAKRVPLANQFEFASAFAWGIAILGIGFRAFSRHKMDWMITLCSPMAFLIASYAALVFREASETPPALKSAWFTLHISSAVFSYASFAIAAALGIRYLMKCSEKNKEENRETVLKQTDRLSYKMICFGMLLLSVVIISGCIWAEQAWGIFWSWDPKETWALITWVVYAIYLHQRLRMKWNGKKMAWFAIIGFVIVLFTFVGVNTLMSGLHSYGSPDA